MAMSAVALFTAIGVEETEIPGGTLASEKEGRRVRPLEVHAATSMLSYPAPL